MKQQIKKTTLTSCILFSLLFFIPVASHTAAILEERDKICKYLDAITSKATGLLYSFTPRTAMSIKDHRYLDKMPFMETDKGYLDNAAFLYDNAIAITALIDCEKFEKARKMLKIFEINFSIKKNNRTGLYNSFNADHFDFFFKTGENKYKYLVMGLDGDRIHLGPNMFIGFAAQFYFFRTKSPEFLNFVMQMYKWVQTFTFFKTARGKIGGPPMGWGWGPDWQKVFSTENVLDYYAFIINMIKMAKLDNIEVYKAMKKHRISLRALKRQKRNLEWWLKTRLYNRRGTFNRGLYGPVYKNGRREYITDKMEALDTNSWAISGIGIKNLYRIGINPFKLALSAERKFKTTNKVNGYAYSGFDFTTKPGYDKRRTFSLVWWEGTAQMALAFKMLAEHATKQSNNYLAKKMHNKYRFYINEMNKFITEVTKGEYNELSYTARAIKRDEVVYVFNDWWPLARGSKKYPHLSSISSTVWRYFAIVGLNPFDAAAPKVN